VDHEVKEDEMGMICSTNGEEDERIYDFNEKEGRKETTITANM
jgi:hypothetical protein